MRSEGRTHQEPNALEAIMAWTLVMIMIFWIPVGTLIWWEFFA